MAENGLNMGKNFGLSEQEQMLLMEYCDRARAGLTPEDEEKLLSNSGVDQDYCMQMRDTIASIQEPRQKQEAEQLLLSYEKETGRAADEAKNQILLHRAAVELEREAEPKQAGRIEEAVKRVTAESERRRREAEQKGHLARNLLDMVTEKNEKGKVKPLYTEFEQFQMAARVRLANKYASRQVKLFLGMIQDEERKKEPDRKKPEKEETKEEEADDKELPELDEDIVTHAKIAKFELDSGAEAEELAQAAERGGFAAADEKLLKMGSAAFDRFFKTHYPEEQKNELQDARLDLFDTIYIGGKTARECFEHKYRNEIPEKREAMMKCEVVAALVSLKEHLSFSRIEHGPDGPMLTSPVDIRAGMKNVDSPRAQKLQEFQESETAEEYQKRMIELSGSYARNIQKIFEWQAEELGFGMTGEDMHMAYERLHEERSMAREKEELKEALSEESKKEEENQKEKNQKERRTVKELGNEPGEDAEEAEKKGGRERTNYKNLFREDTEESGRQISERQVSRSGKEPVRRTIAAHAEEKEQGTSELAPKGMTGPGRKKKKKPE
ncbi:MAG: hypothetical protein J6B85_02055 [Lachnospiraceae bacterium]|nr:hypothetical protein [Lachnospiraceae bacterium]